MTWNQLIRLAKKEYGLKELVWVNKKEIFWGRCSYTEGKIFLNTGLKNNKKRMICVLFHELGHIYCYKNKIWDSYHYNKRISELTSKEKRLVILTGLKAERWVERWAEKEVKKYFPRIKYPFGYYQDEKAKYYIKNYLALYK